MIETTSALLFLRSPKPPPGGDGSVDKDRSDSFREELTESYESREEFASGWRRLSERGWMIARVTEHRAQARALGRFFRPSSSRFEVSYERLVARQLEPVAVE